VPGRVRLRSSPSRATDSLPHISRSAPERCSLLEQRFVDTPTGVLRPRQDRPAELVVKQRRPHLRVPSFDASANNRPLHCSTGARVPAAHSQIEAMETRVATILSDMTAK